MRRNGFTLIELILVAAIIGLLATALLMVLNPFTQFAKAADARRKSDLAQVQRALESYYQDNGQYPGYTSTYAMKDKSGSTIAWGTSWGQYMNTVPQDPTAGHTYVYYSPDGQSYYLYANLARGALDPQACQNLDSNGECPGIKANGIAQDSCGGPCNFGLTSPNVTP